MDSRYEAFCMASPVFYDALRSAANAGVSFSTAGRTLPAGWRREEQDDWLVFLPENLDLPMQGWKIHVSACLDNAERVLDKVWDYCVPRGLEFKFLRSGPALWLRSSKYAPRGYSGKLVTIYPPDEDACERVLTELGELLHGEPGPYILSDLRWGDGPLYVRYGGFASRYCVADGGQVVLAIADDKGDLVPDRRDPVFYVPPWITVPGFLGPHLAARNAVTVADLPYAIESVLHFSNGGGVYLGRDTRTGRQVVLKEGRPHAGLDSTGADAVGRINREHDVLRQLAGVPGVPEVYDVFDVGDHRFMAMQHVAGRPLHRALVRRYPLIDVGAVPDDFAAYAEWAVKVHGQIETTLRGIHERGVVYGDLHLFNIMIDDDDTVTLLDFEVTSLVSDNARPGLGNQGFAAPSGTTGADVDRYALACLRLALFLPMTPLLWLSRDKAHHFAEIIAEHFPLPDGFLAEAVKVIAPPSPSPRALPSMALDDEWPDLRDRMVRGILAAASPERDDRLFPGDIEQFRLNGLGLAYGAAGVLHALAVTGAPRQPELEQWLLDRVKKPPHGTMLGLYDGLHGVAFTLDHLGHRQQALDLLDMCLSDDWQSLGLDLMGGLAGIGLNLAHFAENTGDAVLRELALRAAQLVGERLGDVESVPTTSGLANPYAGLFRGSSGPALLLMRAYDLTGDRDYLDRAAVALRQDLRRCVTRDNGAMEVDEGWRTMPYLAAGSIGIGIALDQYLDRRSDDEFATAAEAVHQAAQARMYIQSGVFAGRAGIVLYLAGRSADPRTDPTVAAQVRGLGWHAMPYADGLAFPGDQLLRLSMDVATGTAGVLLAVGAARSGAAIHLPLIPPAKAARSQVPVSGRHGLVSPIL
ncbi:class III lanthionine synthetase LanKC [Actinoplanes flavus]|uniref:non-specific serine/threonine protein kinase n=1 Tax=Actinoplanes flavus TaxID=2820290 RepID=A0ABS3UH52_9ACTN|nr:class III lanthionine synthetase LanKC [Actinoplanes flavus]MBO3737521.1 class III lanthionine synthetase LanKC [Actinoplanes flavus]